MFVLDYGRHSSLAIPTDHGRMIEYSYGEWQWYAMNQVGCSRALSALFWPTEGTLGRRSLPVQPDRDAIVEAAPCEAIHEIAVDRSCARSLADRLDATFAASMTTLTHHPAHDLDFVRHERSFHACNTCNQTVVRWLRELGCRVRGWPVIADYVVVQP